MFDAATMDQFQRVKDAFDPDDRINAGKLLPNEKVNIRADYYRAARMMCHSLFSTGLYHRRGSTRCAGASGCVCATCACPRA